jgi:hypothetical protein
LKIDKAAYWRWQPPAQLATFSRKNWPDEIVEAFERHDFIWGGKWWHFDTMHFEYRPEIIAYAKANPAPIPESKGSPAKWGIKPVCLPPMDQRDERHLYQLCARRSRKGKSYCRSFETQGLVGLVGPEHPARSRVCQMKRNVAGEGIEPPTRGFSVLCSTN